MPTDRYWLDAPGGSIRLKVADGGVVLYFEGEIDVNDVNAYETAVNRDTRFEGQAIAVDAGGVTFFSVDAVRFLLHMTEDTRSRGRRPIIRGAARPLCRVLKLTGLDELFDFQPRALA